MIHVSSLLLTPSSVIRCSLHRCAYCEQQAPEVRIVESKQEICNFYKKLLNRVKHPTAM